VRHSWLGHFSCRLRRDDDEDAQLEEDNDRFDSTLAGRTGVTVRAWCPLSCQWHRGRVRLAATAHGCTPVAGWDDCQEALGSCPLQEYFRMTHLADGKTVTATAPPKRETAGPLSPKNENEPTISLRR